jgi:AraC-like DNA-binding protein
VESRHRFSYWRDAVCQAILNVDAEPQGSENFEARISGHSIGSAKLACFVSKPHQIVRNRSHVVRAGESGYLVSWQKEGRSRIVQGDASIGLGPGEIGVIDVERSFRVDFPTSVNRTLALIPRRTLEEKAPWFRRSPLVKVEAADVFGRLACDHLAYMTGRSTGTPGEADLLVENICNLLALATAPAELGRESAELPTETLLAFCRKHLYRADLSPPMAASHLKVSVRTVHLRFQRMGTTFGTWVLAERLETCRRALGNAMLARQSISEIAFDCGFREVSHFSKAFKKRYGVPPRDYRASNLLPPGH